MIASLTAALLTLQAAPAAVSAALPPRDPRNWPTPVMDRVAPRLPPLRHGAVLILSKTNGFRDPEQIAAATSAITEIVRESGRDAFATENAAVMNPRDLRRFSTVVLNSTSGNIFDDAQRAAFRRWVERGGGVVLLHGAGGDPAYDWAWYAQTLIGAQFIGHTGRPMQFQQATIDVKDRTNPATRDLPERWTRTEEWYSFDRVPAGQGTRILATLDESTYQPFPERTRMGAVHPLIWTRCVDKGRVFFSALGHKAETYAEALHRKLIGGAIRWASRRQGSGC
ncbi:ThuA domain-containing protein [Novosphingobium flavum]|uniref:ThuA domain-containing protein n=1 Tax=Novosphingobium flavum TaxID=1778672 RepID=A0A7X1FNZ2_9SPHN|nr:ThuA domain-containing protein [Novosphingobium flavum]MBC2664223.1 ThuA domain-containing protein [Novosphingobium flavum]